jgi:hypothetical protein
VSLRLIENLAVAPSSNAKSVIGQKSLRIEDIEDLEFAIVCAAATPLFPTQEGGEGWGEEAFRLDCPLSSRTCSPAMNLIGSWGTRIFVGLHRFT